MKQKRMCFRDILNFCYKTIFSQLALWNPTAPIVCINVADSARIISLVTGHRGDVTGAVI
jgi:hypothetical protein